MPQVTLIPTGQSFTAESGETVLAAALRAGLNLPHSCKGGHCASCRARIVDGTVGYEGDSPPGITADEVRERLDPDYIAKLVREGRTDATTGKERMPSFSNRLTDDQIKMVAAYVMNLGE